MADNKDQKPFEIEVHMKFRGIRSADGNLQEMNCHFHEASSPKAIIQEDNAKETVESNPVKAQDQQTSTIIWNPAGANEEKKEPGSIDSQKRDAYDTPKHATKGTEGHSNIQHPRKHGMSTEYKHKLTDELRIVLIGKSGSGKSASANTILGKHAAASILTATAVSTTCERVEGRRGLDNLVLIDTPGLFDLNMSEQDIKHEMMRCVELSSPGLHAVVLVIEIGRITEEETNTVNQFMKYFGKPVLDYLIILFTKVDELKVAETTLEAWLKEAPESFRKLIDACHHRYMGFNNRSKDGQVQSTQGKQFLDMVKQMVQQNGGLYYTAEKYRQAESEQQTRLVQQREAAKRKEEEKTRILTENVIKAERERAEHRMKAQIELEHKSKIKDIKGKYENNPNQGSPYGKGSKGSKQSYI